MMVLYVDETENDNFFIVTGLLLDSDRDANDIYNRFKKQIKGEHLSDREKRTIYTEFKAVLLDRSFQRIKKKLLTEISKKENSIIYSCYIKKGEHFNQTAKEETYISLLANIVSYFKDANSINIIFDKFNKKDFENRIIENIGSMLPVKMITAQDSRTESGLQLVDNLCSVIRLHRSNTDENSYYEIIKNRIIEI